jgi:hypothetical protein
MKSIKPARIILLTVLSFTILSITVVTAIAVPSVTNVSGSVTHGQIITITGSNFGSHPNYNAGSYAWQGHSLINAFYKDFEDSSLTTQGFSATGASPNVVSVQTGGPNNSARYQQSKYINGRLAGYGPTQSGNTTSSIYTSFWFRLSSNPDSGKLWRWYFGSNSSNDNLYLSVNTGSGGFNIAGDIVANCGTGVVYGGSIGGLDTWHKVEIYASSTAPAFSIWVDGNLYVDYIARKSNLWNCSHTMSPNGHTVEYPDMVDGAYSGAWSYDDIYINYTPARVEICAGSTWAARGICNTQLPTSWSTSSISAAVNRGSFTGSGNYYLYVVDSSNTANANGILVNFGTAATIPNPPILLQ